MKIQHTLACLSTALLLAGASMAYAQGPGRGADPAALQRLSLETGATPAINGATGTVRFVRVQPARARAPEIRATGRSSMAEKQNRALSFLRRNAAAFGLGNAGEELVLVSSVTDRQSFTHLSYQQRYAGVPVFGSLVRVHFDAAGGLSAINGTAVPEITVSPAPSRSADEASRLAATSVQMQTGAGNLAIVRARLLIFRENLAKGVPGANHLAWEVEVSNRTDIREFVYVDAHTGKIVDQITGIVDAMFRRAYDGQFLPNVPPSYPDSPFWVEGQTFPTGVTEADNMILASKDTYDFYFNTFGRDSFDALGTKMDSIFNRGYSCPNASWNGTFISFCAGMTSDDVTGHEWTHAYTQYTDGLIYQWQPGALNESYSDIFGETIDRINGRGGDTPDAGRTAGECSVFGGTPPASLTITGGSAAGSYFARVSVNEPARPLTVGPTDMALSSPAGACTAVTGVSGKIAIVDWTLTPSGGNECGSGVRANNARAAGATGIIFVAPSSGLLNLGASALIASVEVTFADGALIKAGLPASATITLGVGTDNSVRWLVGEDDTATGSTGPLRDMWNPRCFGNPGKVSDSFDYTCSSADQGGVHTNSGVPNHAYSLVVDGGTYNGQTITGLGLTKAAHIYFRAMSVYQTPSTGFPEHADALEASCNDLIGQNLTELTTGLPSGQVISAGDCTTVSKAMLATEMRTPPAFCNFQPLLAPNPPNRCDTSISTQVNHFVDTFESGAPGWTVSHAGVHPEFTPRDWVLTTALQNRTGTAFFGPDPSIGTCNTGGMENGTLYLTSPAFTVSGPDSKLTFDHYVATEAGFDGGNLQISVNGGAWTAVPQANYTFNPYNGTLGGDDPLAGQRAFTGTDPGNVFSTWGRSHVNLASLAPAGSSVRLRYQLGTDGCGGIDGWYVDDVTVYSCVLNDPPAASVDDISVTEGNSGFSSGQFTISLSHVSTQPVTVKYRLVEGTAKRGTDWVPVNEDTNLERTVTIPPWSLSTTVPVRIKGDRLVEPNETYSLQIRQVTNGTVGDGIGVCTIVNDD